MVLSPFFRPWSPLSSSSNLLSSLLLFSSCVHYMIQSASSHLHLGFCMVLFPLKHSSITALGIWASSILIVWPAHCVILLLYHIILCIMLSVTYFCAKFPHLHWSLTHV
jgi:hypothetical protein